MKKTEASKPSGETSDEMLSEYEFDYSKARPNRFASRIKEEGVTVTLDPDVSEVFTTSDFLPFTLEVFVGLPAGTDGKDIKGLLGIAHSVKDSPASHPGRPETFLIHDQLRDTDIVGIFGELLQPIPETLLRGTVNPI